MVERSQRGFSRAATEALSTGVRINLKTGLHIGVKLETYSHRPVDCEGLSNSIVVKTGVSLHFAEHFG